ncbi:MAG TPA: restriction endonuclease subunit R [Chlorobium sp.]|uniref:Type III restriction enzyme, res subunit n=1 Tax=Chlorobium phaeovibrioides (strain DSM 265 / 1930) TaxID=290318 RepID=A4SC93_CHLPM|nr:restriction endonuclease subunit R [Chlorobium sp.]
MAGFVCEERLTYGPWPAFERMAARLAQHAGFTDVAIVGGSGDLGADVVGAMNGSRWVFQAKFRSNGGTDGAGVHEAALAAGKYDAQTAVLATNTYFYENAYAAQREKNEAGLDMRLWNGAYLLEFFEKLPTASHALRELRNYQVSAVEAVEGARAHGQRKALAIMATGLGKSMVANQVIANELDRNPCQEVLVLAHMSDLVRQLEASSWQQLGKGTSTHLWTDGEQPAYSGGVVFATWQSLFSAMRKDAGSLRERFGLVVVDEAHHAPSVGFTELLEHLSPNFLAGLTATPWRGDERSLQGLFGEPVFTLDIVAGMQMGFLAAVDYRMLTDGINWEEVSRASSQGLTVADLNSHLVVPERDIGMVEVICDKMAGIKNPRALAFCRSIEHAERLQPLFASRGVKTALLHSQLPREQRFKNLSGFRMGHIDLLISIEMLNEGIDIPEVNLVAFMRVTHSRRIFLQQLGRGLRISKGKENVLVLDFVADIRRIAAGLEINRLAKERSAGMEVVRYRDGQIVKFDNDAPLRFFEQYLADIASLDSADEDSRLRFPEKGGG